MGLNAEALEAHTPKGGGNTGPVLPAGTYNCTLADVTQKEFVRDERWKKEGQSDMVMKLIFSFAHETDSGEIATINHFVTYSLSEKGNLHKFLRQIDPQGWTPEQRKKSYKSIYFAEYIDGLLERQFIVSSEPSKNGKYNNLLTAMPMPGSAAKPRKVEPAGDLSQLDDDDIPF